MNGDPDILFDGTSAKERLLLLDYDGTLVPFAPAPELAVPDAALLDILEALASRADTHVHVVSGRCRSTLEAWLGHLPIGLHAEHGYWTRRRPRQPWAARFEEDHTPWIEHALTLMAAPVSAVPGTFVERKTSSLAWHYRNGDPFCAAIAREVMREALQPLCGSYGLEILDGVFVMELRQGRANKGDVVRDVIRDHGGDHHVVAIGDDVTDEDMFVALPVDGVAIAAGIGAASPRHRLSGPAQVRHFLRRLCEAPSQVRLRRATALAE